MQFIAIEKTRDIKTAAGKVAEIVSFLAELAGGTARQSRRYDGLSGWSEPGKGRYKDRYLIGFTKPTRPSGSIVQMTTTRKGFNRRLTGLLAFDESGRRWLMHKGNLHVSLPIWTRPELIQETSQIEPFPVTFSDGETRPYYAVANLDQPLPKIATAIGKYVRICECIRQPYDDALAGEEFPPDSAAFEADPNVLDDLEDWISNTNRPGPAPGMRFGNPRPPLNLSQLPAECYILRFAGSDTWKIGWALDAGKRLQRIRTHIPLHLFPETWQLHERIKFPTAEQAHATEQHVLSQLLAEHGPIREQVTCPPKNIDCVVQYMREAARKARQGPAGV
tara:strand:+ start:741 stop:1745 length:1005 start_codon:yes stop_codon:yes gene_type:complete